MTLDSWRSTNGLSFAELGRRLGCSRQQALRLCQGSRTPGRATLRRVAELTGGAVTPNDFFPEASAAPAGGLSAVPANA
jgi:transcriptional regulator with XRE-family HTH domain